VDRLLPAADETVSELTLVSAGAEQTFAAVGEADISDDTALGALAVLADFSGEHPRTVGELLGPALGFTSLVDEPGRARAVGLVARYHAFERGVEQVEPERFATYDEPGRVKAVIAFTLTPQGGDRTVLGCEIRVAATDRDTRSTLQSTWFVAGPALRLLARRLLELIRRRAESGAEDAERRHGDGDQRDADRLGAR
jgi:hypothetical protein